ncbi:PREDICTED: protein Wnt-11b-2-like [Sturnus vulgaris]|uniref:protein Wnt-11b-2-like n=1 Tax=Sturnus vulgaris TaxID=9172 RepID=UPI00071A6C1F|nr:PREDICTED: protein Wnt-11b-2-like [Sturnus vulgaris]
MGRPAAAATALLCQLSLSAAIQWLGLAGSGVAWNESQHCRLLVPEQLQLCRRHLEMMPSIVRAARRTQELCQQSFADMRWNCSSIQSAPSFGPELLTGTREAAFVHALAAAAVAQGIARSCASGEIPLCSCGPGPSEPPAPGSRWGGCGDNLSHGLQLGAAFTDGSARAGPGGTPGLRAVNRHNGAVGRAVLSDSLDTRCKCHGVSGSCSVKTCWKGLPDLGEIASDLKSRYLAALKVTHRLVGPRKQLIPKEGDARPVAEMDLVYLINSPDYCSPNPQLGSLGTQDRPCNRSSVGSGSCDLLCCGRGYNTYTEEVQERCHCRYRWCCSVVCRRCRRSLERHVCK